ncbi:MAG: hypothetical protein IPM07_26715 [Anaerolineales bacterium]|nr:hypothetical protein [Anaerolineales bacterium]
MSKRRSLLEVTAAWENAKIAEQEDLSKQVVKNSLAELSRDVAPPAYLRPVAGIAMGMPFARWR